MNSRSARHMLLGTVTTSDRSDGVAELPCVAEPLTVLLGHSRARLLLALQAPRTTTDLAACLHTSASAVSQLLHRLRGAGLIAQQRQGREVIYALSERGHRLLALLLEAPGPGNGADGAGRAGWEP